MRKMGKNCLSCKWYKIRHNKAAMNFNHLTPADIDERCSECLEEFKAECTRKPRVCLDCEWKDRNLPYEARTLRCQACAASFAASGPHDCTRCVWNDERRRMPTVETLAHCKACIGIANGKTAKNCDTCDWQKMPEAIRRPHCCKCSLQFAASAKVRNSTNELSNKGQTIVSYDNHNPNMTDDRDTVTKISRRYAESRKSASAEKSDHPVFQIAYNRDESLEEWAENAYETMKRFLYEFGQLTDMQALLFLSEVKGEKKTDFARNHNLKDSTVNALFHQLVYRSPIFQNFILLSRGSLKGTRGRKAQVTNTGMPEIKQMAKKVKKIVYAGVFQPTLGF